MGTGFIDYATFFSALRDAGFGGSIAYEMCSPIRGGGSLQNLDRYATTFLDYMRGLVPAGDRKETGKPASRVLHN